MLHNLRNPDSESLMSLKPAAGRQETSRQEVTGTQVRGEQSPPTGHMIIVCFLLLAVIEQLLSKMEKT